MLKDIVKAVITAAILGLGAILWNLFTNGGLVKALGGVSNHEFITYKKKSEKDVLDLYFPENTILILDDSKGCPSGWDDIGNTLKGRMIVAAVDDGTDVYNFRNTGGEPSHTLTIKEMPKHNHEMTGLYYRDANGSSTSRVNYDPANKNGKWPTGSAGEGEPHNNMPPYVAMYFCKKA
ncbi:MAG: hypothetical protein ABJV04_02920 [Aliiglaciecola sp.]|uniref:phage baseplate protein n=1 Tax=Aliiglaciecola sp. TaxID=1872441 RepID=UPI0032996B91